MSTYTARQMTKLHKRLVLRLKNKVKKRLARADELGLPQWRPDASLPKLSSIITTMVEPLLEVEEHSQEAYDENCALVHLVSIGWNIANRPREEQDSLWQGYMLPFLNAFEDPESLAEDLRAIIDQKRADHHNDHRYVVGFSFNDLGHQYHIQAMSLPLNRDEFYYFIKHVVPQTTLA